MIVKLTNTKFYYSGKQAKVFFKKSLGIKLFLVSGVEFQLYKS